MLWVEKEKRMGCGLDTRPAALACLRIIIAALNILIAVSFPPVLFYNYAQKTYKIFHGNTHPCESISIKGPKIIARYSLNLESVDF